jgi:leader peptidase (prepilin peptidase) / N-methyltransferase
MPWLEIFAREPLLLWTGTLFLGLIVGSFLNVVIHRLPRMMQDEWRRECAEFQGDASPEAVGPLCLTLSTPGSRCPHCGHAITPLENIPILSYMLLHGRCSACAAPISRRYPLVEAITALLSLAVVCRFGPGWEAVAALGLTWGLVALSGIDLDTQLLPDAITQPLLWLGLLLSLVGLFSDPKASILGAAAGYLSLWLIFHVFRLATGKEGMGHGDFKLLAVFGAWLGWAALPQIALVSAVVGALAGGTMILSGRRGRDVPIPFGPYLAAAGWIALLWGDAINSAYLNWSGLG